MPRGRRPWSENEQGRDLSTSLSYPDSTVKMMSVAVGACLLSTAMASVATAQTPVPPVTTASPGYLFPNDRYQREREERNRQSRNGETTRSAPASDNPCSPDAFPAAERRAMEARFAQIDRTQGRAAATAYVTEQGRLFSERLIAEGICTRDGRPVR